MKCYQTGYPRPQFVRDPQSWVSLDGSWDFAFDDDNKGMTKGWFCAFPQEKRGILVPFVYESPASGVGDPSRHDVIWYKRCFTGAPERGDKRTLIHLEGCDYNTRLWINGAFAGSHEGGYARFSFDITELIKKGTNEIVVRVEDSFDTAQPRGKQRWLAENFGCWYIQATGIWKTVWLEFVPEKYITSVKMTPVLSQGMLDLEFSIEPPADRASPPAGLEIAVAVSFRDKKVASLSIPATRRRIKASINVVSYETSEWGIAAWTPEQPNLYDISFRLLENGKAIDEVLSYFGMRDIAIDGTNILLNGIPLYQRLILDQGFWKDSYFTPPNEEALSTEIDKILALGYNGVRKHQKTEDERFLYWADMKGLLVWSEAAATYEFNDNAVRNFTQEWMEIVQQNYNHPSIITWTPFNESWGVPGIKNDAAQQQFTEAIYFLTKSLDKTRPVIVNDGWEHTISDIITLHDYEESSEDFLERYGKHMDEILDNALYHSMSRSAFAFGFTGRDKPVIISEFGGIAFTGGDGWGYGNRVDHKEDFIRRFDAITTAIKKVGRICGYCYTQVSDVQQELNGLLDADRNYKLEPAIIREINVRKVGSLRRNFSARQDPAAE